MTLDELQKHALWAELTTQQRKFLLTYIQSNADKLKTGRTLYKAKTDSVTLDMVRRQLRNPKIRKLLSAFQGAEVADSLWPLTRRELSDLVARRLREPKGITTAQFLQLAQLFCFLRGWSPADITDPPPAKPSAAAGRGDSVDDIVLQLERKARERDEE